MKAINEADRARYLKITQQQQVLESILKEEENDLTETKKKWVKAQLDKLNNEKSKNFAPADAMITNEHLANLKLGPNQIQKLVPAHP